MSSDALDTEVDLEAIVDRDFVGDIGIAASTQLLAFTNAVETGAASLRTARNELVGVVGTEGLLEAAATIAIFNGLVRVADGTGIALDAGLQAFSQADRERLGIDRFAGAANTPDPVDDRQVASIAEMFG